MHDSNLFILAANSGQARVLRRSGGSDEVHTVLSIEDGPIRGEARSAPGANHRRDERVHSFVLVLAEHLRELLRTHPGHGLVLAAPSRMLAALQAELAPTGAVRATCAKNLVRLNDHEMAVHLKAELGHAAGSFAAALRAG